MRTFATASATITTVRADGYYPSERTAEFLAKRICFVLHRETPADVKACFDELRGTVYPIVGPLHESGGQITRYTSPIEHLGWNPADCRAVRLFSTWWSYDTDALEEDGLDEDERDEFLSRKSYVLLDLNTGRSLIVTDRR